MNCNAYSADMGRRNSGQTLIGLLVVLLIIAVLAGVMYPKLAGRNEYDASGNVKGTATPIDRAYDTACTAYTEQVTQAAMLYHQDHNRPAPDLQSLKPYGVTDDIINTPDCNFGLPKQAAPATAGSPTAPGAVQSPAQPAPQAAPSTPVVQGGGIRVPVNTSAGAAGIDTSESDGQ